MAVHSLKHLHTHTHTHTNSVNNNLQPILQCAPRGTSHPIPSHPHQTFSLNASFSHKRGERALSAETESYKDRDVREMIRSRLLGEKRVRRRGGLKLVGSLHSKRGSDWSFPCCVGRWREVRGSSDGLLWMACTGGKLRKERKGKETVLLLKACSVTFPFLPFYRQNSRDVPLALLRKYVDKSPLTQIPVIANPLAENRRSRKPR